jgi:hypothetical protein
MLQITNAFKTEINIKIQFLPEKEQRPSPLQRPMG